MMHRTEISAPMRQLMDAGRILGRVLDFGCGIDPHPYPGYDPHVPGKTYHPATWPEPTPPQFDTITCLYVLNVVDDDTAIGIIGDVLDLLAPTGTAYFATRRTPAAPKRTATQWYRTDDEYGALFTTAYADGIATMTTPSSYRLWKLTQDTVPSIPA